MPSGHGPCILIKIVFVYNTRIKQFRFFLHLAFVFLGHILFDEPLMGGDLFPNPTLHNTELLAGQGGMKTVEPPAFVIGVPAKEKPGEFTAKPLVFPHIVFFIYPFLPEQIARLVFGWSVNGQLYRSRHVRIIIPR
jgi:hypothetical protein